MLGCGGKTEYRYVNNPGEDKEQQQADQCLANIKQLSTAVLVYISDYDDVFPSGDWSGVQPYYKSEWLTSCPTLYKKGEQHFHYAFNKDLLEVPMPIVDDLAHTPMFFEVATDVPFQVDEFANILQSSRHKGLVFYSNADGSTASIPPTD